MKAILATLLRAWSKGCICYNALTVFSYFEDMYTFDVGEEEATATYHEVCTAYENIFSTLNLPVSKGMVYMYVCI